VHIDRLRCHSERGTVVENDEAPWPSFPQRGYIHSNGVTVARVRVGEELARRDAYEQSRLAVRISAIILVVVVVGSGIWILSRWSEIDWIARDVGGPADGELSPSVALDDTGRLHIVCVSGDGLVCTVEDELGTAAETAFTCDWDPGSVWLALAVDENGADHIAAVSYIPGNASWALTYTTNAEGSWATTTVDVGLTPAPPSIAVDSLRAVHVSYSKHSNLTYATNHDGDWETHEITAGNYLDPAWDWWVTSIALDSEDDPRVAFAFRYYDGIGYAENLTGEPDITMLVPFMGLPPWPCSYPSLVVDSDDVEHLMYFQVNQSEPDSMTLVHSTLAEDAWSHQYVEVSPYSTPSTMFTSAIIDGDGVIHVCYRGTDHMGIVSGAGTDDPQHWILNVYPDKMGAHFDVGTDGEFIVSKPYGNVGYITDQPTSAERLPYVQDRLIAGSVAICLAALMLFSASRTMRRERTWHDEPSKEDDDTARVQRPQD